MRIIEYVIKGPHYDTGYKKILAIENAIKKYCTATTLIQINIRPFIVILIFA